MRGDAGQAQDLRGVRSATSTADWPGGGAVARSTGKMFFTMDGEDYVCSGAVVVSANTDVVITAAHCVKKGAGSWAVNWVFVPAFTNGNRPYGTWSAKRFFVASQWSHAASDDDDVAFVTLNPQQSGGRSIFIGQDIGGHGIECVVAKSGYPFCAPRVQNCWARFPSWPHRFTDSVP